MRPVILQSPDLHNNAHTIFKESRQARPVLRARRSARGRAGPPIFIFTRYTDIDALLSGDQLVKDPANSTLGPGAPRLIDLPGPFKKLLTSILTVDDPDHRRLRRLVAKAFTPKTIAALAPTMERVAAQQLQRLLAERRGDLIPAFASPFPVHVITELVGVPEADRPRFQRWVHGITHAPGLLAAFTTILPAIWGFSRYIAALIQKKRRQPADDLLSQLAQTRDEGEQINDDELLAMVFLLLTAGHETTVSLIANGTFALLQDPEQLDYLQNNLHLLSDDAPSPVIEELLRYDGPLLTTDPYHAKEAFTAHGQEIPAGAVILPAVLSANRDEAVFTDPDRLDLTRSPNKHLAFGRGLHHCLGAPLARLEAKIALRILLGSTRGLRLAAPPAQIRYRSAMFLHRLASLPVELGP